MKYLSLVIATLMLGACGSASNDAANGSPAESTSVDAVTAEAVSDTQAATADATAAADAELDRLSNSIDDASEDGAGANKADAGSGKAKVVTY